jgi:hypothetical protein
MRAITLMQPWAQLVAVGAKRYETRSWKTHYRGPLAIHASLEFPNSARALCRAEPFCSALFGNVDLPLGCVVAVCDLAAVLPTTESESLFESISEWPPSELPFGDFSPGRFAWLLKNIRALENPIPARGARSLWEWDELALGLLSDTNTQNKNHNMKTKKTTHQFRQGDVLIERVPSLPSVKPATPSVRASVWASVWDSVGDQRLGQRQGPASGPASGTASGPASGPASGTASGPASGTASGPASGTASGGQRRGQRLGQRQGQRLGQRQGQRLGQRQGQRLGQRLGQRRGQRQGQRLGQRQGQRQGQRLRPTRRKLDRVL